MSGTGQKFPHEDAMKVAVFLRDVLTPSVERIEIAGSLRRKKKMVGDVELLFIPKTRLKLADMFSVSEAEFADMADEAINSLEKSGIIKKRLNVNGSSAWGKENKLAVHVKSGIPVDFFATTEAKWWNALVIRTGGERMNLLLTTGANKRGLTLHAYGDGFTRTETGEHIPTFSEEQVFELAGQRYVAPERRP